jgi:ABC-type transport system substrate-binding protein
MAGDVDVHLPTGLGAQQALDLRQRWAGTNNQVMTGSNGFHRLMAPQLRPEFANPAYLLDRRVRQALYRGFDREAYNEALHLGLGMPADSWIPPDDPRRQTPAFRDSIVQYPYDPTQAVRELEALGWRRGNDGMLVNAAAQRRRSATSSTAARPRGGRAPHVHWLAPAASSPTGRSMS